MLLHFVCSHDAAALEAEMASEALDAGDAFDLNDQEWFEDFDGGFGVGCFYHILFYQTVLSTYFLFLIDQFRGECWTSRPSWWRFKWVGELCGFFYSGKQAMVIDIIFSVLSTSSLAWVKVISFYLLARQEKFGQFIQNNPYSLVEDALARGKDLFDRG